jgi:hypothetical protein
VLVPAADGGGGVSASWYDSDWPYRCAITVDNTAGAAGAIDITFSLDATHPFWTQAANDGDDIRITDSDGVTLLTFDTASLNVANKTGTFEVDAFDAAASEPLVIWLYWGNLSAVDARSSFVPASAKTGYADLRRPGPLVFEAAEERQAALRPRNVVAKNSVETKAVFFDFSRRMARRLEPYEGRDTYESIDYVVISAENNGGSASIFTETATRVIDGSVVAVTLAGGTHNTDYVLRAKAVTTLGHALIGSVLVRVRDTDEA